MQLLTALCIAETSITSLKVIEISTLLCKCQSCQSQPLFFHQFQSRSESPEARYVDRTCQRLVDRMRQHVPLAIRKGTDRCNGRCQIKRNCKANQAKSENDSAISIQLLSSVECGNSYNEDCFRILNRARPAFRLKI